MSKNKYYNKCIDFQDKLKQYALNIFKTYGRELVLRLEEYNLLQNKHNCIESSTAIGFVLEEFLVSKLEMYTHCSDDEYVIDRFVGATASESYDCYSMKDGMKFMVNVKSEREGHENQSIAAIQQLHRNYCLDEPKTVKSFVLFKIIYSVRDGYEDDELRRAKPRHLYINDLESYCLEEVDLSGSHRQDNRSWSQNSRKVNRNNGRLLISAAFRRDHKVEEKDISYKNTFKQLNDLVANNITKDE